MKHGEPLTDRMIMRIIDRPRLLDMTYFSAVTPHGTTFCLGGLLLDESNIAMEYEDGIAVALAKGVPAPSPHWIRFEHTQLIDATDADVVMQAKMREVWAREHGIEAAEILPLYALDWAPGLTLAQITPQMCVEYLYGIKLGVHLTKPRVAKIREARVIPLRAVA
jgi:hypothetical protein